MSEQEHRFPLLAVVRDVAFGPPVEQGDGFSGQFVELGG
jgi:hypothetical protein